MNPIIYFCVGAFVLILMYAFGSMDANERIVRLRWSDLSPVGQATWFLFISVFIYGLVRLLSACSDDSGPSDPSTGVAGASGAAGASTGIAGTSGDHGGTAGASGGGHAGASGTSGASGASGSPNVPPGCTIMSGNSDCSGDKKKWLVECPGVVPPGCQKHNFWPDTYCCQVYP